MSLDYLTKGSSISVDTVHGGWRMGKMMLNNTVRASRLTELAAKHTCSLAYLLPPNSRYTTFILSTIAEGKQPT